MKNIAAIDAIEIIIVTLTSGINSHVCLLLRPWWWWSALNANPALIKKVALKRAWVIR